MRYTMENQTRTTSVDEHGEKKLATPGQYDPDVITPSAMTTSVERASLPTVSADGGRESVEVAEDLDDDEKTTTVLDGDESNGTKTETDDGHNTLNELEDAGANTRNISNDTDDGDHSQTSLEMVEENSSMESAGVNDNTSAPNISDDNATKSLAPGTDVHTPVDRDTPSPDIVLDTRCPCVREEQTPSTALVEDIDRMTVNIATNIPNEGHACKGARPKVRLELAGDKHLKKTKSKRETPKIPAVSEYQITDSTTCIPIPAGSLCIITMNVKSSASVEKRRQAIQHILKSENPKLVLFQEYLLERIHKWKDYPIEKHYEYTGNDKASVLCDIRGTHVGDPCHTSKLQEIVNGLKRTTHKRLGVKFPKDFNPIPRICMKTIETKGADWVKFICVSWHRRPMKKTNLELQAEFNYFLEFLRVVHERYKLPLLIGGGFNMDVAVIESLISDPFVLHKYAASGAHKKKKGIVDYFLCTSELQLTNTRLLELPGGDEELDGVLEPVVTYLSTQS